MQQEYDAPVLNHTRTLSALPPGATVMGCKWIFRNKYNANGIFQKHKAQLVTTEFNQTKGLDYTNTFSQS